MGGANCCLPFAPPALPKQPEPVPAGTRAGNWGSRQNPPQPLVPSLLSGLAPHVVSVWARALWKGVLWPLGSTGLQGRIGAAESMVGSPVYPGWGGCAGSGVPCPAPLPLPSQQPLSSAPFQPRSSRSEVPAVIGGSCCPVSSADCHPTCAPGNTPSSSGLGFWGSGSPPP